MTIKEYLKSIGAKDGELTANVVKLMEKAMLFDVDIKDLQLDTVLDMVKTENKRTEDVCYRLIDKRNEAEAEITKLDGKIKYAESVCAAKDVEIRAIQAGFINDNALKDAVAAYRAVLQSTVEVFGADKLTSEVMAEAINAGSYIAWRGIMGPKDTDDKPKRRF